VTRDTGAVDTFVERFAQVLVDAGMPRIASRIFVTILATDSAQLTAGELAEALKASPAAISGGVRYLAQLGMVQRGREPGSRRDYYRVENDVWYRTISQRDELMSRWSATLAEGVDALGKDTAAGERIAESVEFFAFIRAELDGLIERWEARKKAQG
jgi:DNA-binding transcriptional regulator GbsR (MarR family)